MREGEPPLASALVLQVISDADPGALLRVLQQFVSLNLLPHYFLAQTSRDGTVTMRLEVADCPPQMLERISARLEQIPCIHRACWRPASVAAT